MKSMPKTARAAYARRRSQIEAKLARLEKGLEAHHERAAQEPKNWGYAGNLAYVEDLLDQALSFLGLTGKDGAR